MSMFKRWPRWLPALHLVLMTVAVLGWWSGRQNTLFGNGRWIVGKDSGKFVFYTFSYLFRELRGGEVSLTDDMAFQQILYREPEGPDRRLASLRFEAHLPSHGYLWILLRKQGFAATGLRLSRNGRFPGGCFHFSAAGDMVDPRPLERSLPDSAGDWYSIAVTCEGGQWVLSADGQRMGACPAEGPPAGYFGFRGCGVEANRVSVRRVRMEFADPSRPDKTWIEREDFRARRIDRRLLGGALLLAAAALGLRAWRQRILAGYLGAEPARRYTLGDNLSLLAVLAVLVLVPKSSGGSAIPGAFAVAELLGLGVLAYAGRPWPATPAGAPPLRAGVALGCVLAALGATAFVRNGEALGRASDSIWASLDYVDPAAYLPQPPQGRSSGAEELPAPVVLLPGQPFFLQGAWREQTIDAQFVPGTNCTLEVVFQQQSYRTRGDPEGEELPLQRRLLRLSTRPEVPTGMASALGRAAGRMYRIEGSLRPGEENRLRIVADDRGVRVALNGAETAFPALAPLGYGATGFMVEEPEVLLQKARVAPGAGEARVERMAGVLGVALPLGLLLAVWGIFSLAGRISWREFLPAEFAAQTALGLYLAASLFLSRDELSFFGRDRLAWLDLCLCAAALAHLSLLVLFGRRLRRPALLANAILLAAGVFLILFVWDRVLPSEHPLRLLLAGAGKTAPGELVEEGQGDALPWYCRPRTIGTSTYVWRQQFGGRTIAYRKPAGTIRIFMMGGSQAWGSGAASSDATFTALLEKELQAKGLPVEVFNAGVNGAGVGLIAIQYAAFVAPYQPDILIADIGLNDSAALRMVHDKAKREAHSAALRKRWKDLLALAKARNTRVLLSHEAMCSETPLRPNKDFYAALESDARAFGASIFDPAPSIQEAEVNNFVWWDTAHYAPFGHALLARLLEPEVERLVRARLSEPPPASPPAAP